MWGTLTRLIGGVAGGALGLWVGYLVGMMAVVMVAFTMYYNPSGPSEVPPEADLIGWGLIVVSVLAGGAVGWFVGATVVGEIADRLAVFLYGEAAPAEPARPPRSLAAVGAGGSAGPRCPRCHGALSLDGTYCWSCGAHP